MARDRTGMAFVRTGADDLADLVDHVPELVVRRVVVRPDSDPRARPEVAENLARASSAWTAGNSATWTVTVPPRRAVSRGLRISKPASSASWIRRFVWRREFSRILATPISSIRS